MNDVKTISDHEVDEFWRRRERAMRPITPSSPLQPLRASFDALGWKKWVLYAGLAWMLGDLAGGLHNLMLGLPFS